MKKRAFRPLLIISAAILLIAVMGIAITINVSADTGHSHDDLTFTEWTSTNSLPSSAGNYYLASDVTISSTWSVPSGTTNLCLNGHGIRMTGSGSVIYIAGGAALNLYDCDETTEHKFNVSDPAANGAGLATVNDSLTENYQTFVGGYITGGTGKDRASDGYSGGAVYLDNGKFTMYGGTLIGNQATLAGAIFACNNNDVVTLRGTAKVSYNASSGHAGAISLSTGGYAMSGKLYIMENVELSYNRCTGAGSCIHYKGGTFELSGGYIHHNEGNRWGALCIQNTGFKISGNPVVTNNKNSVGGAGGETCNIKLDTNKIVTIGTLTDGASVGMTMNSTTGAFTSGWNTAMGNADPAKYFTSDNANYGVLLKDGEAQIGAKPHEHDGITFEKWTSTNSLPSSAGNYCLTGDVTISSTWNVPSGETNLCLNGHSIVRTNASGTTGSVIQVGYGAMLNLYDCGTQTRYYTIANPSANGAGLGTVVDESTYNAADENARGTFKGGYITGGVISGNLDNQHLIGGGVNVDRGSFTMYGGTIIGNKTCINSGGVKVKGAGASFTMNGGAIIANDCDCYGGGISVGDNASNRLCSLTINGGTIARNWSGRNGGAIHMDGYNHKLIITGGNIVNNYTNGNYDNGSAGRSGGGILKASSSLTISGNPIVKDNFNGGNDANNIYLISGNSDLLTLSGLTTGADIGISFMSLNDSSDTKIATGAQKEDIQYLHYDISDEGRIVFCDGEKDWICLNGEFSEYNRAQHTHEAGTVWASMIPHEHDGVTFAKWTSTNSLPTSGNYCLKSDVTVSSATTVTGTLNLCLCGHGVRMSGNSRIFYVNGGTFSLYDCDTTTTHKYTIPSPAQGAGLAVVNDNATGDNVKTFVGGYITGANTSEWGAAVCIENGGILTLNGGTIIGNNMSGSFGGGAVALKAYSNNRFVMNGGAIIGNTATNGWGGGLYIHEGASFTMNGGVIKENYASKGGNGAGGGISIEGGSSSFILTGGQIINNVAQNHGGNVNLAANTIQISGNVIISGGKLTSGASDNVFINGSRKFNVVGALDDETSIGITLQSGTGVFTSGWSTYMTDGEGKVADPADYFVSNNSNYVIKLDASGEAKIAPPHTHAWSYEAVDNVITATCTGTGTCDLTAQTITISATGKVYDGTAVTATVTKSTDWSTNIGLSEPSEITYSGNTDAGTYTASVTVGDATAEIEFVIEPLTMTVTSSGYTGDYDGAAHGISVTVTVPDGATVKYGTEEGVYTLDACPTYTNAGTYTVYYEVTKANYITATGSDTVTINQINATVTITGHNNTVDYDGTEHTVIGYDAIADTTLYDVTKDFTFSGNATASQTNAGTANMGLAAEQFANTSANFATVTFIVTDGYQTINQIDATVTIIGEGNVVDYDGDYHGVSGYDATPSTPLYDVTKDFTFSGNATASCKNVGSSRMGLEADQFQNINPNFRTVTFEVTDGYITVLLVDAVVKTEPESAEPVYNGSEQSLIIAGEAEGGMMYYAIGESDKNSPRSSDFSTSIPTAKDAGEYFVWYKVIGDMNHNDLEPKCLKVELTEEELGKLHGVVYQNDGETPIEGARVELKKGDSTIDSVMTDKKGKYKFDVADGIYNIVAAYENGELTALVTISGETEKNIVMPDGKTNSALKVSAGEDGKLNVVVGGLDEEAYSIRKAENIPSSQSVSVVMTVEGKTEKTAVAAAPIIDTAKEQALEFFEIKVEKTVGSVTTLLDTTSNVLEIVVPYEKADKKDIKVYSYHGESVKTFTESESRASGTFRVDAAEKLVYIYSDSFSTYAIGYTPYYKVSGYVSLGSFSGTATVTLTNTEDGSVFTLDSAAFGSVGFESIPGGKYQVTITWEDGVENTLTLPLTIGNAEETEDESEKSTAPASETAEATELSSLDMAVNLSNFEIIEKCDEFCKEVAVFGTEDALFVLKEARKQRETVTEPRKRDVFLI